MIDIKISEDIIWYVLDAIRFLFENENKIFVESMWVYSCNFAEHVGCTNFDKKIWKSIYNKSYKYQI